MRIVTPRASAALTIALVTFLLPLAASACQECFAHFDDEWCQPVRQGDTGYTICFSPEEASCCCSVAGNFCADITVNGGGNGSGGSGGSNVCETTGFCPAECFSCAGGSGGGRPAV